MEKHTHLDIELLKYYDFRELTAGASPIGEMLRSETLDVYADPSENWTSESPSKPAYYGFKIKFVSGHFTVLPTNTF